MAGKMKLFHVKQISSVKNAEVAIDHSCGHRREISWRMKRGVAAQTACST
ncbi:MAG: hypothetical protein LBP86_06890 [Azoarcus sp.]|jgi:hypothetical protein|nr:hypothetical protein [Azoarcus sp.]